MSDAFPDIQKAVEKLRAKQRVVNAFHRTFDSTDGKLVLETLRKAFRTDMPAFLNLNPGGSPRYDLTHAAKRDGQRDVILQIEAFLAEPVTGDANINTAKRKVKKQ